MHQDGLVKFIDDCAREIVNFTGKLISTPSITPPGDERKITSVLLERLDSLGLKGALIVGQLPERPNVLYRLRGTKGTPTLLYVAHTDTKPVGDSQKEWQ